MNKGIFILDNQRFGELAEPLDRRGLPEAWASDLAALEPWVPVEHPVFGRCLRSKAADVDNTILATGPASSSLDLAWEIHHAHGLADWDAVLPLSQREGRGQMRRPWSSPPGNM